MALNFSEWLTRYAEAAGISTTGDLVEERTLIVQGVVCTFVHPCNDQQDMAVVLLDAGEIATAAAEELAHTALSRNLENFLLGAPQFFINPASRHLVMGQKFAYSLIDPLLFAPSLEALALQAKAWHGERSAA